METVAFDAPVEPLFICGCGHSGTTLLSAMFAAHPNVFIPLRETYMFEAPETHPRVDEFVAEFRASGKPYAVEKTPRHIHRLPAIRSRFPKSKFVLMVRDGRDVAASIAKRFGKIEVGMERWVADNEVVLVERSNPDVFVLRYEDLIVEPEKALREVCQFAVIPFSSIMLSYHERGFLWFETTEIRKGTGVEGPEHLALRNWQVNQPIFDGRGSWVGKLSVEQLAQFEAGRGGELLTAFGYGQ